MSEYRPPDLVAGYVARRLLSSDSTTIPGLRAPTPTETAELGALAHVFAGVRVTPAQAQRAAARASARRTGVAAHAGWARRADGKDADERALARAAVAPVRALADALFAGTGTTTESPADSDSSAKDPPFTPFGREDALALAAARWFKHEFFRWVDPIKCAQCGSATQSAAAGTPTEEERAGGAGRVEVHRCTVCGADRRFPRYNRVRALIASREGRCGEFAQLFYIFLLTLGLDARYVWNSEDHVWTEYWSPTLGHWVHADSCEAEISKPQLYDRGWGKSQRWCLSFGPQGGEDVSRAYIDDWDAGLARRMQATEDGTGVNESLLQELILRTTVQCRAGLDDAERARLAQRDALQAAWIADADRRDAEAVKAGLRGKGRASGTKEWVETRGEGGDANR